MSKLGLLIRQIYKQKVSSKAFILLTLLYVGIAVIALNWQSISSAFTNEEKTKIAVVDTTQKVQEQFRNSNQLQFKKVQIAPKDFKEKLVDEQYDGILYVEDEKSQLKATLYTADSLKLETQQMLSATIDTVGKIYTIQQMNLTAAEANKILTAQPIFEQQTVTKQQKSEDEKMTGIIAAYIIGFLIYFFVITYLSMITTDIASEKGSRVLEVLMATVRPSTHLISKIVGVFFVGCTQIALLIAAIFIVIRLNDGTQWTYVLKVIEQLSMNYVWLVFAFMLFTLLLYLILGALAGSFVSKVEEASQMMMPVMMLVMIGFFAMVFGMSNPDSMLIKVLSYVPFTSGMVMTLRYGATDLSVGQALLSLLLLIVTVVVLFLASLTVYKRSVLTYSTGGLLEKWKATMKVRP